MKKFIRLILFLFFSGLLVLLPSCEKEEPETYDIWLPDALKSIFAMKPGTYWVMESANGPQTFRDSVYVTGLEFDTLDILHPGSQLPYAAKDRFRVKCFSLFYGREFHLVSETNDLCNNVNNTEPCFFVRVENYNGQGQVAASSRIYYHPGTVDNGWNSGTGESKVRVTEVIPSYTINGNTYTQVYRVETDRDPTQQNNRSIRYISPEAGIIQLEVPSINVNWITIRSNIVR